MCLPEFVRYQEYLIATFTKFALMAISKWKVLDLMEERGTRQSFKLKPVRDPRPYDVSKIADFIRHGTNVFIDILCFSPILKSTAIGYCAKISQN
jgi:hypothetical protein